MIEKQRMVKLKSALSLVVFAQMLASVCCKELPTIDNFEEEYFKARFKSTGIYEIDAGFDNKTSYWLAAFGDVNADRK